MATPGCVGVEARVAGGSTGRLPIGLFARHSNKTAVPETSAKLQHLCKKFSDSYFWSNFFACCPSQITRDDFCSEDRRQVNQEENWTHQIATRPPSPGHTHRFVLVARALIRRIPLHAVYGSFERTDQRAAQFQLEAASTKKANGSCISLSLSVISKQLVGCIRDCSILRLGCSISFHKSLRQREEVYVPLNTNQLVLCRSERHTQIRSSFR